jgi:hypothetical protein
VGTGPARRKDENSKWGVACHLRSSVFRRKLPLKVGTSLLMAAEIASTTDESSSLSHSSSRRRKSLRLAWGEAHGKARREVRRRKEGGG